MEHNKLLSVIVPVYNTENYLKKCIESIVNQTYFPLEIILVDDGSTDSSGKICDFYEKKYDNISVVHMKNSGITAARLRGVEKSQGSRVTFVDSDDWIDMNYYQSVCENDDSDLIATEIYGYFNEKHIVKNDLKFDEGIYSKEEILKEIIPVMMWDPETARWAFEPSLCTKIFKREIILSELRKVQKVGSNYGEDSMVTYPLMLHVDKVKIVKNAFYYHRQRERGKIAGYIENEDFFIKVHEVYEYLRRAFRNERCYELMQKQLDNFYIQAVDLKKQCYKHWDYEFTMVFPFEKVTRESKVILYGAGKLGKEYIEQNEKYHFCEIILWVDKNCEEISYGAYSIEKPELIQASTFDYIIIAIDNYYIAINVIKVLCEMEISKDKIIWHSTRVMHF